MNPYRTSSKVEPKKLGFFRSWYRILTCKHEWGDSTVIRWEDNVIDIGATPFSICYHTCKHCNVEETYCRPGIHL
jgi:hypothetical protein